jgi:hypothetical protein
MTMMVISTHQKAQPFCLSCQVRRRRASLPRRDNPPRQPSRSAWQQAAGQLGWMPNTRHLFSTAGRTRCPMLP